MPKQFKFIDSVLIEPSIKSTTKTDATGILSKDRGTRLEVEIDATHSGVLTNRRVYPAKYVSTGYLSFFSKQNGGTSDYDKPILKHHDLEKDAIGRVVGAKYTQLKFGDQYNFDYLVPDEMGSRGSGVVTVKGIITDPDSISKIIDGRFLSVSAGHITDTFLCSVCGDSLYTCEHMPGETYSNEDSDEQLLCYGITGKMTYNEVSFVNLPAQPPAKLLNFNWKDSSKDSWNSNAITSFSKGKKDLVRTFKLIDENGELSLLDGEYMSSTKKTVIAVSPAIADKLKHRVSSVDLKEGSETSDVHKASSGDTTGVLDVEQNLDKANLDIQSNKESNMDAKQIEDLNAECQSLKDKLATATAKEAEIASTLAAKDSEIQRLTKEAADMQTEMSKSLALTLATLRVKLQKADTKGIDSKEQFKEYIEKLSSRTNESLRDSIEDTLQELPKFEIPNKDKVEPPVKDIKDLASKDKLDGNTLSKGDKPVIQVDKKVLSKKATDLLNKHLDI